MSGDILYSPWRMQYIIGEKEKGCIFCIDKQQDAQHLVVHRRAHCFVIMNLYPYNNGHVMAVPCKHVSTLGDLSADECAELFHTVRLCERVIKKVYNPEGLNVGINIGKAAGAGIDTHLHVHILPRWNGDTNFMTSVGGYRVIPEDFEHSYEKLKKQFDIETD